MKPLIFWIFIFFCNFSNALDVPYLSGRVMDWASILNQEQEREIEQQLIEIERQTSAQVVVFTLVSLEGDSIESFSLRAAETWELGVQGKDNGVLLLISLQDRKMRIEVGYGLEGDLSDVKVSRIIRYGITPYFKQGNYFEGVKQGVTSIGRAINKLEDPELEEKRSGGWERYIVLIVFLLFSLLIPGFVPIVFFSVPIASICFDMGGVGIALFAAYLLTVPLLKLLLGHFGFYQNVSSGSSYRRDGWGSGGGGFGGGGFGSGGGFSGGGGGFGGGGASGGW